MSRKWCITVLCWVITSCLSQGDYPRPTFPDVFQTEIEGTFIQENGVIEIDASMFFDRTNNRAGLFVTKDDELTRLIYNFDSDEILSIDGNNCDEQEIPEEQGFFPFTVVNGKKKMAAAEKAFFFTESKLESQALSPGNIPTLVFEANLDIPQFGKSNCNLTHIFSKPDFQLSRCKEGLYCNSTLITLSVKCKNEEGQTDLQHTYRFSRFKSGIEDVSVFLPPPGVHCDIKNTRQIPPFPSYFSFSFDIIEKLADSPDNSAVFNTHKEVWYDAEYRIIRIDEFDFSGLLYSSRIFDLKAGIAFTIIASVPTCDLGPINGIIKFDEITRLPKSFFAQNETEREKAVHVGKRKVHGLDYEVWSREWTDHESDAKIVEDVYFHLIVPSKQMSSSDDVVKEPYSQLSHVDMYTYEMGADSNEYELVLLKYFSINNYRTKPKEWAAFDVSTCFTNKELKLFAMKVEGPPLVKESQSYREVLQLLYDNIIAATGVSVVRISELRGIFDGVKLSEIRGSILENSESLGWPKDSKEPGMEETFKLMKKAAAEKKLSVTFYGENNTKNTLNVTSVEEIQDPSVSKHNCFSGSSLAAASLVLLLIGVSFGIAGYYVFLKKRRTNNSHVRMSEIKE